MPVLAFLRPLAKPFGVALLAGAAWWGFMTWRDRLVEAAENRGFARAEAQYQVAVAAADKIAAHDTNSMTLMGAVIGGLAAQRTQAIDLKVTPQIERIQNEVASDPRYRDCRVSDGVLGAANAARAAVDAGIAASNPVDDRPRPATARPAG